MRILGFSEKWPKLEDDIFTTFRFTRKDKRDWAVGELVQIVVRPRSKEREVLGIAEIVAKEPRYIFSRGITPIIDEEARRDGFEGVVSMLMWLIDVYGRKRLLSGPMNRLVLRWETIKWTAPFGSPIELTKEEADEVVRDAYGRRPDLSSPFKGEVNDG